MKIGNPHRPVTSAWLTKEGHRLDAPPFLSGAVEARVLLDKLAVPKQPLRDVSLNLLNPGRMSRTWVTEPEFGLPFLRSSDILAADLSRLPLISRKVLGGQMKFLIREGWTLITRSGTIGRMAYARPEMDGMACSEDVLRVIPNPEVIPPGYLYAYLSSRFGKILVTSGTYGAIIQHIEPEHIADLDVPRFGYALENEIHALIYESSKLLNQFGEMIRSATNEMFNINHIDAFTTSDWHKMGRDLGFQSNFSSRTIRGLNYNPRFTSIKKLLSRCDHANLGELVMPGSLKSGPRFKRIDAEPEHSYMLIGQRDVFSVEPEGRWISKNATSDDVLVAVGSTVMAAQGTFGEDEVYCRPVFIWDSGSDYAYSQHFLRIIPNPEKILPGYLFAFLRSEYAFRMFRSISIGTKLQGNHPDLLAEIPVPLPSLEAQQKIHDMVTAAHEKRWEAVRLEQRARQLVERAIEQNYVPPEV